MLDIENEVQPTFAALHAQARLIDDNLKREQEEDERAEAIEKFGLKDTRGRRTKAELDVPAPAPDVPVPNVPNPFAS